MTKSEHFYKRQYQKYLREASNPTIKEMRLHGQACTAEQMAEHRAKQDLVKYKLANRRIHRCCNGMKNNLSAANRNEIADSIVVIPDYRVAPDKMTDDTYVIVLAGNRISHCPFCGNAITILEYKETEFEPSHE